MCGICGAIQISGDPRVPLRPGVLDRMTDAMIHRGPNDRGTHVAPGVALGARRLSIVDVEGGHQPFANEDGTVVGIQNGELYNHDELRRNLQAWGHSFRSRCDTEILPHLYEHYGPRLTDQLRGKFGLAVWDAERRSGVIARDRLGVKPIYYAIAGDLLLFASELKSLLASGLVRPDLDYEAIDAYLTLGFVPAPRTPLVQVRKLLPGERIVVQDEAVKLERYWRYPEPSGDHAPRRDVREHAEDLLEVLDEAVRLRLMSDVPLGAMLSGGLDSSLIVALMARHTPGSVKTFSVGFAEAGADNELAVARRVASLFGTDHHEVELSLFDESVDLPELAWHLDEPVADLSALGFLALSKLTAETVTVALSGQGADELLGGYSRHRNAAIGGSLDRLPRRLQEVLLAAGSRGPGRTRGVAAVLRSRDAVSRQLAAFSGVGAARPSDGGAAARAIAERLPARRHDPLATMLFLDGQLGLVDDMLHYFDRTSMARSLEVRVPFLDHRVVEHCARIPSRLKVRNLTTKYLLKEAARGLLPDEIIDRKKVGFFNSAVDAWFAGQVHGLTSDYLLSPAPAYAEFVERDHVARLVAAGGGRALLPVLMLEVWLREFLPRAMHPPAAGAEREVVAA
jgi:asparagine synthase (glutamine-hydrolysing)